MVEPTVANVVGTINFQREIALDALADTFSERDEITEVIYEPGENHWLQTNFAPDNTYVAFYRSGKSSIAGGHSVAHFYEVAERVSIVVRDIIELECEIQIEPSNIVATWDTGSPIPLESLMIELGMTQTEYEPEQFPALIYRGDSCVILVFSSGKQICTGLSNLDDVGEAIESMIPRIQAVR